jgi:hypothetical protein
MSGWRREGCRITASPDLNTLFPASANLLATMANKINERGQISGMAIVLRGPDAGNIHAFLATHVNGSIGISVADVAPTRPNISLPQTTSAQTHTRSIRAITGIPLPREGTFALTVFLCVRNCTTTR